MTVVFGPRTGARMWCGKCQSDVVTELATDNRRVTCSTCGTALGEAAASQTEPANQRNSRAQEARELLNRWANGRSSDPFGPPRKRIFEEALQTTAATQPDEHAARTSMSTASAPISSNALTSGLEANRVGSDSQRVTHEPVAHIDHEVRPVAAEPRANDSTINAELDRLTNEILARVEKISRDGSTRAASLDDAHQAPVARPETPNIQSPAAEQAASSSPSASVDAPATITRRIDAPVLSVSEPNHSTVAAMPQQLPPASPATRPQQWVAPSRKAGGLMSQVGPGLSYVGILGITLGLSLVILGTFGASSNLAPTGWLIATLGQMVLLLGVVTSVSVGMEQTSADLRATVDERMRVISEQLDRLTQTRQRVDAAHSAEAAAPHFATMPQRMTATHNIES